MQAMSEQPRYEAAAPMAIMAESPRAPMPAAEPVFAAAPAPAPAPAPMPAPAAAPIIVSAAPAPVAARIEPFMLPLTALQTLAEEAGMQWVGSDAEKIRAVQAAIAAEPKATRVPREPRRVVVDETGPLVLVETKKDLSQISLPFERR